MPLGRETRGGGGEGGCNGGGVDRSASEEGLSPLLPLPSIHLKARHRTSSLGERRKCKFHAQPVVMERQARLTLVNLTSTTFIVAAQYFLTRKG